MSRNLLKDTRNRTGCNDHRTSGKRLKAPDLFIKMNLEWFYRLICQPSRLGRMMKLPKFVFGTIIYKLSGKAKKKS